MKTQRRENHSRDSLMYYLRPICQWISMEGLLVLSTIAYTQ